MIYSLYDFFHKETRMLNATFFRQVQEKVKPNGRAPFEIVGMMETQGSALITLRHVTRFSIHAIKNIVELRSLISDDDEQ